MMNGTYISYASHPVLAAVTPIKFDHMTTETLYTK